MIMQISKPALKIGGWGLVAGALVILTVSFCLYRQTHSFVQSATRTRGTVVRIEERIGRGSGPVYYPVLTFTDSKGQEHEINLAFGGSPPAYHYKVGDPVTVLYGPGQPENARLYSFLDVWGTAAIPGGLGVVALVVGLGMLVGALVIRPKDESTSVHAA